MAIDFITGPYVSLGQPAALDFNPQSAFTITAWVYAYGTGTIVGKRYSTGNQQYQLGINTASYYFFLRIGTTAAAPSITGSVDMRNAWHHVCAISYLDGATWKYYGLVDAGETDTTTIGTQSNYNIDAHVLIGARRGTDNTDAGYLLDGLVDDVRFYNRTLSNDEIKTIYHCRGRDRIYYGLIGRYFLLENSPGVTLTGTGVIKDESINKNNGTPNNNPTQSYTILRR